MPVYPAVPAGGLASIMLKIFYKIVLYDFYKYLCTKAMCRVLLICYTKIVLFRTEADQGH